MAGKTNIKQLAPSGASNNNHLYYDSATGYWAARSGGIFSGVRLNGAGATQADGLSFPILAATDSGRGFYISDSFAVSASGAANFLRAATQHHVLDIGGGGAGGVTGSGGVLNVSAGPSNPGTTGVGSIFDALVMWTSSGSQGSHSQVSQAYFAKHVVQGDNSNAFALADAYGYRSSFSVTFATDKIDRLKDFWAMAPTTSPDAFFHVDNRYSFLADWQADTRTTDTGEFYGLCQTHFSVSNQLTGSLILNAAGASPGSLPYPAAQLDLRGADDSTTGSATSPTLNSIGTSTGPFTVTSSGVTNFPGRGCVMIGTEIITYKKVDNSKLEALARGRFGTTAATHSNGDTIRYLSTAEIRALTSTPRMIRLSDGTVSEGIVEPQFLGYTFPVRQWKSHAAYAGSGPLEATFAATTSNATQATLATIPIADNTVGWCEVDIAARDTGGTHYAAYKLWVQFRRQSAGNVAISDCFHLIPDVESSASLDATLSFSTTSLTVLVTGLASTTIIWGCAARWQNMSGAS